MGSIVVMPALSATARMVGSGMCPAMAPVSPRQRSAYSLPSTSTTRAPLASAAYTGCPPTHMAIQLMGTPASREPRAFSCSSRERG